MTKDIKGILDSNTTGRLRARTEQATTSHIRKELKPVLDAIHQNQEELHSCVRQMRLLLRIQKEPWRKAGAMLWGVVMGLFISGLVWSAIKHSNQTCTLGSKIMSSWSTMTDTERALIEKIAGK